jgi:hypothetical protein
MPANTFASVIPTRRTLTSTCSVAPTGVTRIGSPFSSANEPST